MKGGRRDGQGWRSKLFIMGDLDMICRFHMGGGGWRLFAFFSTEVGVLLRGCVSVGFSTLGNSGRRSGGGFFHHKLKQ